MRRLQLILILALSFSLTGCFEIIEEVILQADGSGQLKYIINFSQSSSKIKSLLLMDEVEGQAVPSKEKIKYEFEKVVNKTKKVKGISSVKSQSDLDNFIFTYQCDFKQVENLNAVMDSVKGSENTDLNLNEKYFSYSSANKVFKRKGDELLKEHYEKMSEGQKVIFVGATYTCLYRFQDEIDSLKSVFGKMSKDKLTAFSKLDVLKLTDNGQYLNHEIKLK